MTELARAFDGRRISFAQCGEDIVLLRAFGGQGDGFWIDVGANHPVRDSVTHNFSALGWKGINVEPVESLYRELVAHRPRDVNVHAAIGEASGRLTFHRNDSNWDLSTFDPSLVALYRQRGDVITEVDVEVFTLAELCEHHGVGGPIDFLKIDTEGHELAVLRGHDFERFPVRVVIAEVQVADRAEVKSLLQSRGLTQILFDGLNTWFVNNDEVALLGDKLRSPATAVLDWYHPSVYLEMLAMKDATIEAMQLKIDGLEARLASVPVPVERRRSWVARRLIG